MRETLLKQSLRLLFKPVVGPKRSIAFQRRWVEQLTRVNLPARGVDISHTELGGIPSELVQPARGPDGGTLLYLHGGGYVLGSPKTHRSLTTHLAQRSGYRLLVPDYRLAPEHPHPAALDDAFAAWNALASRDDPPALAGDSAGAGLALALAHRLRDEGCVQPRALVLLSPWVDLRLQAHSLTALAQQDPMLTLAWLQQAAQLYAGETPEAPACSPLIGEHRGLPRTLVHVGTEEVLRDDAQALAAALHKAGVSIEMHSFDGLWHDFHMHAAVLPRAAAAIDDIATFLRRDA